MEQPRTVRRLALPRFPNGCLRPFRVDGRPAAVRSATVRHGRLLSSRQEVVDGLRHAAHRAGDLRHRQASGQGGGDAGALRLRLVSSHARAFGALARPWGQRQLECGARQPHPGAPRHGRFDGPPSASSARRRRAARAPEGSSRRHTATARRADARRAAVPSPASPPLPESPAPFRAARSPRRSPWPRPQAERLSHNIRHTQATGQEPPPDLQHRFPHGSGGTWRAVRAGGGLPPRLPGTAARQNATGHAHRVSAIMGMNTPQIASGER